MIKNNKIYTIKELAHIELKYSKTFEACPQKHYHNLICILALKEGMAKIIIKDKEYVLDKKTLLIINPNEVHYSLNEEYNKDYYVLYLDRTWYKNLQNKLFLSNNMLLLENEIKDETLREEFFIFFNDFYKEEDLIQKELKLLNFLENLLVKFINKNEVLDFSLNSKIAQEFKTYIEGNLSSKLTLTEISQALDISVYHIIRVCKQDFGLSASAYIVNKRVHRAKKLLSQGYEIIDIANNLGFYDQSHFTNIFKKVFAMTPKAYQKQIKENKKETNE